MTQPPTILFTRRRWDRLFAVATTAAIVVAGIWIYLSGQFHFLAIPIAFVGMWIYFRRTTPASGKQMETIGGNPWTVRLLAFLVSMLLLTVCFVAFDRYILDNPINGPLHWYHWLFFVVMFSIMTIGAHLIGRASKRKTETLRGDETSDAPASPVDRDSES